MLTPWTGCRSEVRGIMFNRRDIRRAVNWTAVAGLLLFCTLSNAERVQGDEFDKAPIQYKTTRPNDAIAGLQARIDRGDVQLPYEEHFGYLRGLLKELQVPESSQMLVFSKTSLQRHRIAPRTPRALYFSDSLYIGFCQRGDVLEVSSVDPQLGTVYYTLDQEQVDKPQFSRQHDSCLICHASSQTNHVPGHLVRSVYTDRGGFPLLAAGTFRVDHSTPLKNRWGGWYVTGTHGETRHLGNVSFATKSVPEDFDNSPNLNLTSVEDRIPASRYLTPHSDIVALMVLEHQAEGHNLLTRASFETRMALHHEAALNQELGNPADHRWGSTTSRIKAAVELLVKYLLFADEAPPGGRIEGTSGFAQDFAARGPFDSRGRSLREFDLERRMFKYPCSYLVYSPSFDGLPADAKSHVLHRMWEVLSGRDQSPDFAHLSGEDRQAILEILRETWSDLPAEWRNPPVSD